MNYTYILQCADGTYYTGWTNNLEKRVEDHNQNRGAKYTRSRTPVKLVYSETFETKSEALKERRRSNDSAAAKKEVLIAKQHKEN